MSDSRFSPLVVDQILETMGRIPAGAPRRTINMATATSAFDVKMVLGGDVTLPLTAIDRYGDPQGILEFRQAICDLYARRAGIELSPSQIFVTDGALGALTLTFARLLSPGDEAIVPAACFCAYQTLAEVFHAKLVYCPLDENGFYDRRELEKRVGPRTKFILVNSPSNPLGSVASREDLEYVASLGLPVVSDEVYDAFSFDAPYTSMTQVTNEAFTLGSFSKAFGLAGLRLGYLILPRSENPQTVWEIKACTNFQTSVLVQQLGLKLLAQADTYLAAHRAFVLENRNRMVHACEDKGLPLLYPRPSGYFGLVDAQKRGRNAAQIGQDLITDYQLAIMPSCDFGPQVPACIRLNFAASPEDLSEAIDRVASYLGTV